MTNEEAIKVLEKQFDKSCGNYRYQNAEKLDFEDALWVAISALRQQEAVTNRNGLNEPLTLAELRQMDGEPVFVVTDRLKEWCLVHSHNSDDVIGGGIIMTRRTAEKRTYQYACYGKTWLAYRSKKEV